MEGPVFEHRWWNVILPSQKTVQIGAVAPPPLQMGAKIFIRNKSARAWR